ncbi:unnamed protein product [Ascophyllum nodosum]
MAFRGDKILSSTGGGSRAFPSQRGGDRLVSSEATTTVVALSRGSSSGRAGSNSRSKGGGNSDDDSSVVITLLLVGASLAGALAFARYHRRGPKWMDIFDRTPKPTGTWGDHVNTAELEANMRSKANERALRYLGVKELNIGHLPEGAEIVNLPNQVGGHKLMKEMQSLLLLDWAGKGTNGKSLRFVLKILHDGGRGLVELGFYEKLAIHLEGPGAEGEDPDRTKLAGFLCPYFGAVKVVSEAHTDENGEEVPATSASFLVLQDMCSGLDNPCAMDVKMGRTTVEPGEREEKKQGQLKKYPNQSTVGFRYVGMSWSSYFEGDQQPTKLSKDKSWGAKMSVEDSGSGLATFFHDGRRVRRGRVLCALRKIRAIADLFAVQSMFTFYASSILLTYDSADPPAEGGGDEEEEVEVRMIDFAHAVPQESMAETPADKGYLYGARNLVAILEELLEVTSEPDAPVELEAINEKLTYMSKVKEGYSPLEDKSPAA